MRIVVVMTLFLFLLGCKSNSNSLDMISEAGSPLVVSLFAVLDDTEAFALNADMSPKSRQALDKLLKDNLISDADIASLQSTLKQELDAEYDGAYPKEVEIAFQEFKEGLEAYTEARDTYLSLLQESPKEGDYSPLLTVDECELEWSAFGKYKSPVIRWSVTMTFEDDENGMVAELFRNKGRQNALRGILRDSMTDFAYDVLGDKWKPKDQEAYYSSVLRELNKKLKGTSVVGVALENLRVEEQ